MIERFDNFCMKPIFIHKYTKEKEQIADDFANDFCVDGGKKVEHQFGRSITTVGAAEDRS